MVTPDGFLTGLTSYQVNRPRVCSAKLQTRQTRQAIAAAPGLWP
jgi:hypothetical protein